MNGSKRFTCAGAQLLFHFDEWIEYLVAGELYLDVIAVIVVSAKYNGVLFTLHNFRGYQAHVHILHKLAEIGGSHLAVSGEVVDVERANLAQHHFGLCTVHIPAVVFRNDEAQGKAQ